jgi:hypothetical protein
MGKNLPSFPLRKNLLNKGVEALRVGVKFELGS